MGIVFLVHFQLSAALPYSLRLCFVLARQVGVPGRTASLLLMIAAVAIRCQLEAKRARRQGLLIMPL